MERRPIQLLVDIIPFQETLQLIIEGGTITNITSSKQQLKIGNTPASSVQVNFVQKELKNNIFCEKTDISDEEDEEEEHDQSIVKPKQSILEQCLRNQLALSATKNGDPFLSTALPNPQLQPKSGANSTSKPVKESRLAALIAATPSPVIPSHLLNGHIEREVPGFPRMPTMNIPKLVNDFETQKEEEKVEKKMETHFAKPALMEKMSKNASENVPEDIPMKETHKKNPEIKQKKEEAPEQVPVVESTQPDALPEKKELEAEQNDNKKENEKRKEEPEKITPKRKRGRPFKKDVANNDLEIPNKKAKTDGKVRTRSRSRPEGTGNCASPESPIKEDMSKFIKKELVENNLPDFVCQLCGFRLDQERYVQKHVKLRHAGEYHGSLVDSKSVPEEKPTNKKEVEEFTSSRRQGHYTRNRNRESKGSVGDSQDENDQSECKTPDSKGNDCIEKESPSLNRMNECSLCGKSFPSRQSFHNHIETVHNIPVESRIPHHTCSKCQIEFAQLTMYENHMLNVHSSSNKLTCTVDGCEAKVNTPAGLKRHISRMHGLLSPPKEQTSPTKKNEVDQTSKEDEVKEPAENVAKLEQNNEKVEVERPRVTRPECKTCGKRFISVLNLQRHEESCVAEKAKVQSESPIPTVKSNAAKSPVLIRDNNNTISKPPKLQLEGVDTPLKIPQLHLSDIALSPKLNSMISPSKSTEEQTREFLTSEKNHVVDSMAARPAKQSAPANIIPMRPEDIVKGLPPVHSPTFSSMSSPISPRMSSPTASTPKLPKLQCSKCSLKFISQVNLQRHEKYAHTSTLERCPYPDCDKVYDGPMSLKCHVGRMHAEKNHPCEQCHKSFGTVTSLRSHIKTVHQKIKDIVCPWPDCGKTFGRSSHLDNHMKRHRGEMNFGCQYCEYKCIQRASLNYHMRHSHPHSYYCRQSTKIKIICTPGDISSQSPGPMSPGPVSPATPMSAATFSSEEGIPMSSDVSFDKM